MQMLLFQSVRSEFDDINCHASGHFEFTCNSVKPVDVQVWCFYLLEVLLKVTQKFGKFWGNLCVLYY